MCRAIALSGTKVEEHILGVVHPLHRLSVESFMGWGGIGLILWACPTQDVSVYYILFSVWNKYPRTGKLEPEKFNVKGKNQKGPSS